jgi:hypothetical protein
VAALIEGALAAALERNRERLNAHIASLTAGGRPLDTADLADHLRENVAPAVEAVQAIDPASSEKVALALFDLSLDLFTSDLLGRSARVPAVAGGWKVLLPHYARLLRLDPRRVAGAITNALTNVAAFTDTGPGIWIDGMASLHEQIEDIDTFLHAGRAEAWRAGLAHYRSAALDSCTVLPAAMVAAILGITAPEEVPSLLERFRTDPWIDPGDPQRDRKLSVVTSIGAFRGFGGGFFIPPRVQAVDDRLIVSSGDRQWELYADRFGATLLPLRTAVPQTPKGGASPIDPDGNVKVGEQSSSFPELAGSTSAAAVGGSVAVTPRYSHAVFIVGAV